MEKNQKVDKSDLLLFAIGTACQMGVSGKIIPKSSSGKIATVNYYIYINFIHWNQLNAKL